MDYAIQNNCCSCNSLPLVLLATPSPPLPPPPSSAPLPPPPSHPSRMHPDFNSIHSSSTIPHSSPPFPSHPPIPSSPPLPPPLPITHPSLTLTQDNDEYPQLDVDDVLKIDEELRRQRLRDLLQTAKEPVEARTWGGARAVCGRCATTYFAVYTDVCNFPLCSTSPCTGSLGSPMGCPRCHPCHGLSKVSPLSCVVQGVTLVMGCPRCHPCHGLSKVSPLSWVVQGVTLVMGCPRCHPCHGLSKVSPLSCVAQGVTLVSRWSLLHVYILNVFILQGLAATCIVADSVLSLTHVVSLALSKDHTTIIHTHLYVCIYHCSVLAAASALFQHTKYNGHTCAFHSTQC